MLMDRRSECRELERLVDAVQSGMSRALVLRGEAAIGPSPLLEYRIEEASR